MLNPFDDYPVHQGPEPVIHACAGNRNAYDRYFFNGYDDEGTLFFAAALGIYPNRQVIDASFSILRQGTQRSLHASGRLPLDRSRTEIGPLRVEVIEPLRSLRIVADAADLGIEADLTFSARTVAVEEPRFTLHDGGTPIFDYTRLAQWGTWSGSVMVDGERLTVSPERHLGSRDRSWGIRPLGESPGGAPSHELPQFFWLWAPLNFDDACTHFDVNELADGRRWHQTAMVVPLLVGSHTHTPAFDTGVSTPLRDVTHDITWEPGTRRARLATMTMLDWDGGSHVIALEPMTTFAMRGLGYIDPEWAHGTWKGELAVGSESWIVDQLDPLDFRNVHVQHLVRASWTRPDGSRRDGVGVLEVLAINEHLPSGLTGFLDGARS